LIIRNSEFNVTTIWPELVNKRIKTVDIQLKESQITKRDDRLLASGLVQRRVIYLDYDGRNRKAEDRLQFEMVINDPNANLEPDRLVIDLQTDYFVFQPRRIGESQAVFEHGFRVIIHCKNDVRVAPEPGTLLPLLVDVILEQGQGATILGYPVFFKEPGIEPKSFQGKIQFIDNMIELPIVTGQIKGIVAYVNCKKLLCESEYVFPLNLLLKVPSLTKVQYFRIQGRITDTTWWFDVVTQEWRLELKLEYQWRILEKKEVICVIQPQPDSTSCFKIQTLLLLKELKSQLPKSFLIPIGNLIPTELKFIKRHHNVSITKKGVLLTLDLDLEIYTIDDRGQESHQCHPVTWDELITVKWGAESIAEILSTISELEVKLIKFSPENGNLKIDAALEYQIRLYQNRLVDINESEHPTALISGKVLTDHQKFCLVRSNILMLRAQPVFLKEFKVRRLKIHPQNHEGWLNISGQVELSVTYLDRKQNLREDTFSIFIQESFLWDKLQATDEVRIEYRLEHDSLAIHPDNPFKLNYRFMLALTAESFQERELNINTVVNDSIVTKPGTVPDGVYNPELEHRKPCFLEQNDDFGSIFNRFEMEGEVSIILGKARDIENGRFMVHNFNYRSEVNLILIEGEISGALDYWDGDGYLRSEPVGFTFWKCFSNNCHFDFKNGRILPELHQLRYILEKAHSWRKGRVKISFRLELKQIIKKEGNLE
jgi:hypothetical protein